MRDGRPPTCRRADLLRGRQLGFCRIVRDGRRIVQVATALVPLTSRSSPACRLHPPGGTAARQNYHQAEPPTPQTIASPLLLRAAGAGSIAAAARRAAARVILFRLQILQTSTS